MANSRSCRNCFPWTSPISGRNRCRSAYFPCPRCESRHRGVLHRILPALTDRPGLMLQARHGTACPANRDAATQGLSFWSQPTSGPTRTCFLPRIGITCARRPEWYPGRGWGGLVSPWQGGRACPPLARPCPSRSWALKLRDIWRTRPTRLSAD